MFGEPHGHLAWPDEQARPVAREDVGAHRLHLEAGWHWSGFAVDREATAIRSSETRVIDSMGRR